MAYDIDALPGLIELGHLNEKGVSEIQFDVSAWLALYPTGEFSVTYIRPGETDVYPVDGADMSVATVGLITTLTWTVSDAVTAIPGSGSVVIQLTVGSDIVKKSDLVQTIILTGHGASESPPEPLADYIQKWGAVDISVSALGEGVAPTASITQGETGTSISLGIPKGDTGAQGIQGIQGVQGIQGLTGADGASAYDQAALGGYNDDEATFMADLAAVQGLAAELAAI